MFMSDLSDFDVAVDGHQDFDFDLAADDAHSSADADDHAGWDSADADDKAGWRNPSPGKRRRVRKSVTSSTKLRVAFLCKTDGGLERKDLGDMWVPPIFLHRNRSERRVSSPINIRKNIINI